METKLSVPMFYILFSLCMQDRHGYDIIKTVKSFSSQKVRLAPGTLYGAIKTLMEDKLIEVAAVESPDPRRKYYRITDKGRDMVNMEMQRMQDILQIASKHNLLLAPAISRNVA